MTTPDRVWLTIPEVARELRVSVPTVRRWIRAGHLAAARIGVRSVRIRREDLAMLSARAKARHQDEGEMREDERGLYMDVGDHSLTADELLTRLRRHQAQMLRRNGGRPFSDSVEIIREAREEWYADS